ncbi:MAG: hypothetical protein RR334_00220 [Clostridia bacterium]
MNKLKLSSFVLLFIMVVMVVSFPLIALKNNKLNIIKKQFIGEVSEYNGVIEVWNIDTFEGGTSSKTKYLETIGLEFSKMYKGLYVLVSSYTPDEANALISAGKTPHVVSYGVGSLPLCTEQLIELDSNKNIIDKNILKCGIKENKQLALGYMKGGYVLVSTKHKLEMARKNLSLKLSNILYSCSYTKQLKKSTKNIKSLVYGNSKYLLPEISIINNGKINIKELHPKYITQTNYEAFNEFILNNAVILLGNQKDVVRMENLVRGGKVCDVKYEFLSGANPLVQYVSVFKNTDIITKYSKLFAEFLLSPFAQKKLKDISMFSVTYNKLYDDGVFADMEKAVSNSFTNINVFSSIKEIEDIKKNCYLD